MIRYHLSLIFLVLAACILQQFLPAFDALYGARIHLLPLVFLCCAVTIGCAPMLLLAFFCGILTDAQNTLSYVSGDPEIYHTTVDNLRFGYSIILFGFVGVLMQGVQPLFRRGVWQLSAVLSGIATFIYLIAEYSVINIVRGDFYFPAHVFYRIWITSALNMLLSPLLFFFLFKLARWFNHTIRYDGLKRHNFRYNPNQDFQE